MYLCFSYSIQGTYVEKFSKTFRIIKTASSFRLFLLVKFQNLMYTFHVFFCARTEHEGYPR